MLSTLSTRTMVGDEARGMSGGDDGDNDEGLFSIVPVSETAETLLPNLIVIGDDLNGTGDDLIGTGDNLALFSSFISTSFLELIAFVVEDSFEGVFNTLGNTMET